MQYMKNRLGAWQVGDERTRGKVEFKIFFPLGPDPQIASIRVAGDFQKQISPYPAWSFENGFPLISESIPEGTIWSYRTEKELASDFYQYKYLVTFKNGESRIVSDPCCRYGGSDNQNAAFVIGGSRAAENIVKPLKSGRKHLRELIIYELMIDDFTSEFRTNRAPLEAIMDKLDYLKASGFNAILFMPWTTWKSPVFNWGYDPFQYFAVEYRYANAEGKPAEKLSWLKKLISACHERDIHVIMDGVYNHTSMDFPYKQFYLVQIDCPYTGTYGGTFTGLQDLDFNNACTNDFILDVCLYWSDVFGIDGIRLDNTVNFYKTQDHQGLSKLIPSLNGELVSCGQENFSLTLEHIDLDAAQVTNEVGATSYWDNALYDKTFQFLFGQQIDSRLINTLTNQQYLDSPAQVPTIYLSNHDHSQVAWQAGGRENCGRLRWYKTQPYVIALYTSPATPLIYNGAEFAEDYWLPEDDHGTGTRVSPRPLRWARSADEIGTQMAALYQRMAQIRQEYPGLQSPNFEPLPWGEWQTQFNPKGYGIDVNRQLVIYHRWGEDGQGRMQQFVVVLNFGDEAQLVSVPIPEKGLWTDLLSDYQGTWKVQINEDRFRFTIGGNWGHVFYKL